MEKKEGVRVPVKEGLCEEIMLDRHLNQAQSELQSKPNLGLNFIVVTDCLLEFSKLVSSLVKM